VFNTVLLTLLAAALAVGVAPLLLLLVAPWPWGQRLLQLIWAIGRLWPPPLTALLLLFVLKPGVITAALALGFHNLGILGRLLLEGSEAAGPQRQADSAIGGGCGRHGERCRPLDCQISVLVQQAAVGDQQGRRHRAEVAGQAMMT
jgi:phosphonate transport system permease protein